MAAMDSTTKAKLARARIIQLFYLVFLAGFIASVDEDYMVQLDNIRDWIETNAKTVNENYNAEVEDVKETPFYQECVVYEQHAKKITDAADKLLKSLAVAGERPAWQNEPLKSEEAAFFSALQSDNEGNIFKDLTPGKEDLLNPPPKVALARIADVKYKVNMRMLETFMQASVAVDNNLAIAKGFELAAIGPERVPMGMPYKGKIAIEAIPFSEAQDPSVSGGIRNITVGDSGEFSFSTIGLLGNASSKEIEFNVGANFSSAAGEQSVNLISRPAKVTVVRPTVYSQTVTTQELFKGCRNQLKYSVPELGNVVPIRVKASKGGRVFNLNGGGGTWIDAGNFVATPTTDNPMIVDVSIVSGGRSYNIDKITYNVKKPPHPVLKVREYRSGRIGQNDIIENDAIDQELLSLAFKWEAQSEFRAACPQDATYEFKNMMINTRRSTASAYQTLIEITPQNAKFVDGYLVINLVSTKNYPLLQRSGARYLQFNFPEVYRINFRGERVQVPLTDSERLFTLSIN